MKSHPPATHKQVAARFESARREFETWRQSRTGRSPIPGNLWILAVELARECGLFQTARELRLNYCALRDRLDSKRSCVIRRQPAAMDFVEVVPSQAAGYSECTIEIERGRGARVRIYPKSREAPDLGEIGAAFLRARMIQITPQMRILVAIEATDFRRGIDGLIRVCKEVLQSDPFSGSLFVFRNRRRTSIKCLVFDGQGCWLMQKRMSAGRFRFWPPDDGGVSTRMEAHELHVLLAAGNPATAQAAPAWRRVSSPV